MRKQRGLAILTVLLIVALMVTLLGFLVEQQHLLIRRIGNQNIAEQGYQYALGVNAWAARLLRDDQNRAVDFLDEDWAKFGKPPEEDEGDEEFSLTLSSQQDEEELPSIDFGIEGLEFEIIDLQSRYNLNNLAVSDPSLLQGQKAIFLNLLEIAEVDEFDAREQLYAALVDWLDENDLASANGVESGTYQTKSPAYYAADQKLSSLGELRFVEGFNSDVINKLKPYVAVLPVDNVRINLNTASAEVVSALSSVPVVDAGSVTAFLSQREDDAFLGFQQGDIQAAITAIIGASPLGRQPVQNMMQVNSQFFQVNVKVALGDYKFCMQTIMLRKNAEPGISDSSTQVRVLNRQYDTLCEDEAP